VGPSQSLDGEAYARASRHQKSWGEALVQDIALQGTERVLDLGCGDGVVTGWLAERLPRGSVLGIDKSASMIAKASQLLRPNLAFRVMAMEQLVLDEPFAVIFSNAAVHWVRDQDRLLRDISALLQPGGRLLFQITGSCRASVLKAVILETASQAPYRRHFPSEIWPWYEPYSEEYTRLLEQAQFSDIDIDDEEVPVIFNDDAEVATWLRQPTLVPFTERMPAEVARTFAANVERDVFRRMRQADGRLVECFRRFKASAFWMAP
jgi:trans-aconitate 2-methyltransferase